MANRHLITVAALALVLGTAPALAAHNFIRDHGGGGGHPGMSMGGGGSAFHAPHGNFTAGRNFGGNRNFAGHRNFAAGAGQSYHFPGHRGPWHPGQGPWKHHHHPYVFDHGSNYGPAFDWSYGMQPSSLAWCQAVLAAPWRYSRQQVNYCSMMEGG